MRAWTVLLVALALALCAGAEQHTAAHDEPLAPGPDTVTATRGDTVLAGEEGRVAPIPAKGNSEAAQAAGEDQDLGESAGIDSEGNGDPAASLAAEALAEADAPGVGAAKRASGDLGEAPSGDCPGPACKETLLSEVQKDATVKADKLQADVSKAASATVDNTLPAGVETSGEGETYIPLSPTLPKLTILQQMTLKGRFAMESDASRQFTVNNFADVSATASGVGVFGGNAHVLAKDSKDEFRYSNSHGQMGGIAFATNYPHFNKASVVSSGTKSSTKDGTFDPKVVATFTGEGNLGLGVTGPASKLHIQGDGNSRLLNVNHWGDVSGCASGVASFSGNAYVTTENSKANFRYSNAHSGMGAIGFATNYPDWNKASIYTSGTTASDAKQVFTPKSVMTFTHQGFSGIGTTDPKAALHVTGEGRQVTVNQWLDISSQGAAGFIGLNAHITMKDSKRYFAFSNTASDTGAIGMATNYPLSNQLSIVASKEGASSEGTLFEPTSLATFTREGLVGFGTDAPKARVDVRHASARQISANNYADVSANEDLQGFFGGNGYAVGKGFNFANTNAVVGAIGLATHYPKPGEASIISSGSEQPTGDGAFTPTVLAKFSSDGSMSVSKDMTVTGDLKVMGRVINGDSDSEYDFMAAHESLVRENSMMRERLSRMEAMMMSLSKQ